MKFVLVAFGSRGDVEPGTAVGAELARRGHDVQMAVSPHMVGFVEAAGISAVPYGPDSQGLLHDADVIRDLSAKMQNPLSILPEVIEHANRVCAEKVATLRPLVDGADLIVAGIAEQGIAGMVAEHEGIALAALHLFPARLWSSGDFYSRVTKTALDAQRRALGLPEPAGPSMWSAANGAPLQIQAYERWRLPRAAAGWVEHDDRHPFIGTLTLEAPMDTDDEVLSWIAAGPPPIYFGFGSTPVEPFAGTAAAIGSACSQLGQRALICRGPNDSGDVPPQEHVKLISEVNHGAVLPHCRAIVHHGGSGTTAAALRAALPMLILWLWLDQPIWAAAAQELEVGLGRQFSQSTSETLVADLSVLLEPRYTTRAREVGARMSAPASSIAAAADLLEEEARASRSA